MVAAALLSLALIGVFSTVQVVDKSASIVRENRKFIDWHAGYVRQRALTITSQELTNLGVDVPTTPSDLPDGSALTVRLAASGVPGLYQISSTLSWQNMSQTGQTSTLATLFYRP